MSDTIPSEAQILAAYSHLCALAEEWAFSKQTVFRLPELIEEMRDSAKWYEFKGLSLRDHKTPGDEIPAIFVRRVLRRSGEDESLRQSAPPKVAADYFPHDIPPLLYQWTNGQYLSEFVVSLRGRDATAPFVNVKEALRKLGQMHKKAFEFLDKLDANHRAVLAALVCDAFDTERGSKAAPHHLRDPLAGNRLKKWIAAPNSVCSRPLDPPPDYDSDYVALVFQHISDLYSLFARIKHAGYMEWTISHVHFSENEDSTRSGVFGYLLKGNQEEIFHLSAFHRNMKATPSVGGDIGGDYRHQKPGWFATREENVSCQAAVTKLYEGLFFVFNDDPAKLSQDASVQTLSVWHQIVLPVYAHDHIESVEKGECIEQEGSTEQETHQLHASGAFLGWLFLNIQPPDFSILIGETVDSKRLQALYKDVVDLRYLLNAFADKYLAGEMQWALDDESVALVSPEEAVKQGMHHCSGWEGVEHEILQGPPKFGFFEFRGSPNRDAPWQDCHAVTPMELLRGSDIQYFRVLLTEDGAPPWSVLTLRKHPTTLIPEEWRRLRAYGQAVAQRVRDFHSKASLIAERRKSGTIEGQKKEWEAFGHEMKHIAGSLGEGWLLPPENAPDIPGRKVVLFPELIIGAGSMMYLWSPRSDIYDLLPQGPEDRQSSLAVEGFKRVWNLALFGVLAHLAKGARMEKAHSVRLLEKTIPEAKRRWMFGNWWNVVYESDEALAALLKLPEFFQNVLRVFCMLSNNVIRHAAIDDPERNCVLYIRSHEIVVETDTADERDQNPLTGEFGVLNAARTSKSEGAGKELLKDLLKRLNAPNPPPVQLNGRHKQYIAIPLPHSATRGNNL